MVVVFIVFVKWLKKLFKFIVKIFDILVDVMVDMCCYMIEFMKDFFIFLGIVVMYLYFFVKVFL